MSEAAENGQTGAGREDSLQAKRAGRAWLRLRRSRSAAAGTVLFAMLAVTCLGAGLWAPYHYNAMDADARFAAPNAAHWLGGDIHGRDVLTRILHGGQVSLLVGVAATAAAVAIGVAVGLLAGFFGGWTDGALMRLTDTVFAFPSVLLALAVQAVVDRQSVWIVAVILGMVGWPGIARVVRAQALTVRELDYVRAACLLGAGRVRLLLRHVLPNIISPVIVMATLAVGSNILSEAGLSFLGLGTQEPIPSWGKMLADGIRTSAYPWLAIAPGAAIMLTVLSVNLFGDGLRDALDPRMKLR
jgi:peptide/nickel transport system permease protein